jgi:hypothetical protein
MASNGGDGITKRACGRVRIVLAVTDFWIVVSSIGSAATAVVTAGIAWLNYNQRKDELHAQHEELLDRQAERRERERQRRRHERTILLALQDETQDNIRICKQHLRQPLGLAAWRRWAEELPEFAESVFQAAKGVEPLAIRVNHAIDNDRDDATVARAEDEALQALFTLAGWINHGLKERANEQAEKGSGFGARGSG